MKEGRQLEWKESWRSDFCKAICGFAGAGGGVLVVGRDDKGKIVGVSNAPKLIEDGGTTPETNPDTTVAILAARSSTTRGRWEVLK
jgi:predicted HTH transcriptional regulator